MTQNITFYEFIKDRMPRKNIEKMSIWIEGEYFPMESRFDRIKTQPKGCIHDREIQAPV